MSSTPPSILLRGGVIIEHASSSPTAPPTWRAADILLEGNTITSISPPGTQLPAPSPSTLVLDCTNKIISPGLISTHNHLWQTALKGRHADDLIGDYMGRGMWTSGLYTPDDAEVGTLAGALELLDAGTTTVLDFAHGGISADHVAATARGLAHSGIRAVYATGPTRRAVSYQPAVTFTDELVGDWWADTWAQVHGDLTATAANGRVTLGLQLDRVWDAPGALASLMASLNPPPSLTTVHDVAGHNGAVAWLDALEDPANAPARAVQSSVPFVAAHATGNDTAQTSRLLAHANVTASSTPRSELHMATGAPVCFEAAWAGRAALGVDCHSHVAGNVVEEARAGLAWWRGARNLEMLGAAAADGKAPTLVGGRAGGISVKQAFNLMTVGGAASLGMQGTIGRLAVGHKADLVVWDAMSPAMVAGAQHDPVAAIVLNSSVRDVAMVIVDGVIRKKEGALCDVVVGEGRVLAWSDVASRTVRSREQLQRRIVEAGAPGADGKQAGE